tara:strand:+ start:242 stop:655 length:414 start_codon:yes stop_codon:yes gene_type:complete
MQGNGKKQQFNRSIHKIDEIKSDKSFATPGTSFKATKPGTSNQPKRETSGDRAKKAVGKVLTSALTGSFNISPHKMKDLSGDGKVTKKDVLIGRGVLNKDGSPVEMGHSPVKMYGKDMSPMTMKGASPLAKYGGTCK